MNKIDKIGLVSTFCSRLSGGSVGAGARGRWSVRNRLQAAGLRQERALSGLASRDSGQLSHRAHGGHGAWKWLSVVGSWLSVEDNGGLGNYRTDGDAEPACDSPVLLSRRNHRILRRGIILSRRRGTRLQIRFARPRGRLWTVGKLTALQESMIALEMDKGEVRSVTYYPWQRIRRTWNGLLGFLVHPAALSTSNAKESE
jgi:hypothetical protein